MGATGATGATGPAGADGAANAWGLNGTAATAANFIGTTNAQPFVIKVQGTRAAFLSPALTNVSFGYNALNPATTGADNTALGTSALSGNASGSSNTAIGKGALQANTMSFNTAVGTNALAANTDENNTAVGANALAANVNGFGCTAVGAFALETNTGGGNTAMGYASLNNNLSATLNTAYGRSSLDANTTGNGNTAVGYNASRINVSGGNNSSLGANCGPQSGFTAVSNATALGYGTITDFSNQVHLGNFLITQIGGYSAWSNLSDIRFKKSVSPEAHGLDFILKLEPITYHIDVRKLNSFLYGDGDTLYTDEASQQAIHQKEAILYSGFSAQQVELAAAEVGYDFSGVYKPQGERDHYALAYAEFVVPLVKAVQELNARNEEFEVVNAELQHRLMRHDAALAELKAELARMSAASNTVVE